MTLFSLIFGIFFFFAAWLSALASLAHSRRRIRELEFLLSQRIHAENPNTSWGFPFMAFGLFLFLIYTVAF